MVPARDGDAEPKGDSSEERSSKLAATYDPIRRFPWRNTVDIANFRNEGNALSRFADWEPHLQMLVSANPNPAGNLVPDILRDIQGSIDDFAASEQGRLNWRFGLLPQTA